ncbi:unnamed protein product [Discosporangium mesarthrocarpum]
MEAPMRPYPSPSTTPTPLSFQGGFGRGAWECSDSKPSPRRVPTECNPVRDGVRKRSCATMEVERRPSKLIKTDVHQRLTSPVLPRTLSMTKSGLVCQRVSLKTEQAREQQDDHPLAPTAGVGTKPRTGQIQLTIDDMFRLDAQGGKRNSSRFASSQGMDVDQEETVMGATKGSGRGKTVQSSGSGTACYVCRNKLLVGIGRATVCSHCDRGVCTGCSQECKGCGAFHCSLCLCTDYSERYERYFCLPCYEREQDL